MAGYRFNKHFAIETGLLWDKKFYYTEGKYFTAQANQEGLDFSIIQCWWATDALGRTHRLNVAPWYKRRLSTFRLQRKWKHDKKAKGTSF